MVTISARNTNIYKICKLCKTIFYKNPFPANNFSKNKTKVIPNKECIILTHNLLKLYILNLNQIHLQQCLILYLAKHF